MVSFNINIIKLEKLTTNDSVDKSMARAFSLIFKDYGCLKIFFTTLCCLVLAKEFYFFIFIKPTLTTSTIRKLEKEDFPEILICPEPSADDETLKGLGYNELLSYVLGLKYDANAAYSEDQFKPLGK